MLQGIEAEVGLAGGVRMAVDGHNAAFLAELGILCHSGQWTVNSEQLAREQRVGKIGSSFDSLVQQPAHAGTSPWRVASRAVAQGFFRLASVAEIMGWR